MNLIIFCVCKDMYFFICFFSIIFYAFDTTNHIYTFHLTPIISRSTSIDIFALSQATFTYTVLSKISSRKSSTVSFMFTLLCNVLSTNTYISALPDSTVLVILRDKVFELVLVTLAMWIPLRRLDV